MILSWRLPTLVCSLAGIFAAGAEAKPRPDAAPEIVRTAAGITEVGTLGQVPYRIDVPAAWNHALVVYFHGYSESSYTYRPVGR